MRIGGADKLQKQFRKIPKTVEARLVKTVRLNTERTARLARALAPVDSGETKSNIFTQYDEGGLVGSVEAAPPTKEAQIKARSIEFGRKKGNRGTTAPSPYMRIAQQHTGRKFQNSIKAAIRKGLKEATSG
jgi:hypothetical protein